MELGLLSRVALVTGGGRGLGRVIAQGLAAEGAKIAALSRSGDELDETVRLVREAGAEAIALQADLSDPEATTAAIDTLRSQLGPPELLILNHAAMYPVKKLHSTLRQESDELIDVDLRGSIELCRQLLPDMMLAGFGRIVGIGSLAARTGIVGGAVYSATKAALEGLIRGIATEYGRRGVTANIVALGFVETERLAARIASAPDPKAARQRLEEATARKRIALPHEIADVVTFLCSPRAGSITGAVVDATGGSHLANLW